MTDDRSRRDKIIAAAIKIFSRYGYEKASTTMIARQAQISKGLIFHYFDNKAELFMATHHAAVDIVTADIYQKVDFNDQDLFSRLRETIVSKMDVMKRYPEIFEFLKMSYLEDSPAIKPRLNQMNDELLGKNRDVLYRNIDTSRFREGIDMNLAIMTMSYTLEKWSDNYVRQKLHGHLDQHLYEELMHEIEPLLQFFRTCFYKEEEA